MSSELATRQPIASEIERVLIDGDLSKLTPEQRVSYYNKVCDSLGLNPLTRPFDYIRLNGKLTLYAKKDCTEQLRKNNGVSISSMNTKVEHGACIVIATGRDREGREDAASGVVALDGLRGEGLANAMMKAETKAKRRLTLSLCGLGWTDESEVGSIPNAKPIAVNHDTGEIIDADTPDAPPAPDTPPPPSEAPSTGAGGVPDSWQIDRIEEKESKNGKPFWIIWTTDSTKLRTFNESHRNVAEQAWQDKLPVSLAWTDGKYGKQLESISLAETPEPDEFGDGKGKRTMAVSISDFKTDEAKGVYWVNTTVGPFWTKDKAIDDELRKLQAFSRRVTIFYREANDAREITEIMEVPE